MFEMLSDPIFILLTIINAGVLYITLYYFLYCLKNKVDMRKSAGILLGLVYLCFITCPLVYKAVVTMNNLEYSLQAYVEKPYKQVRKIAKLFK